MKKLLKRNSRDLYHFVNGEKKYNKNDNMTGNCTGLIGDCSGLEGNLDKCREGDLSPINIEELIEDSK